MTCPKFSQKYYLTDRSPNRTWTFSEVRNFELRFTPKKVWHWLTYIGIIKKRFEKCFHGFVWGRKIDVQRGMLSFASISVTLRKNTRGRIWPAPRRLRVNPLVRDDLFTSKESRHSEILPNQSSQPSIHFPTPTPEDMWQQHFFQCSEALSIMPTRTFALPHPLKNPWRRRWYEHGGIIRHQTAIKRTWTGLKWAIQTLPGDIARAQMRIRELCWTSH